MDLPTAELVIRNGQPVWLIQGAGVQVQHSDRHTAAAAFIDECQRRGLQLPGGGVQPRRGPSEVDEPGV
jgi:anaerobic selenocysteine-containing dehydrogenase